MGEGCVLLYVIHYAPFDPQSPVSKGQAIAFCSAKRVGAGIVVCMPAWREGESSALGVPPGIGTIVSVNRAFDAGNGHEVQARYALQPHQEDLTLLLRCGYPGDQDRTVYIDFMGQSRDPHSMQ